MFKYFSYVYAITGLKLKCSIQKDDEASKLHSPRLIFEGRLTNIVIFVFLVSHGKILCHTLILSM